MATSLSRATVAAALALIAIAVPQQRAAAQMPMSGVEQARVDSLRRPYTQADIDFMAGMISHHSQAVTMAGWCESHGASEALQTFCGRIARGQSAEIGLMQGWLRDRNQPVPMPDSGAMQMHMSGRDHTAQMHMASHDHAMMMPGMLSPEQMAQLDSARGVEFDRLFLAYMIRHHRGALSMVADLFNTPGAAQDEFTFKFANNVQADQITEIDRMEQMLIALPPKP